MNTYLLIQYTHFLGIFCVVGVLFAELVFVRSKLKRSEIKRLFSIDGLYGIGAFMVLAAGLLMWLAVGKPAEFYSQNWIFHTKVTLFMLVGVLSTWPTVFFIKNRKGDGGEIVVIPVQIRLFILIEVILVAIIPLLAVLMASGVGVF